jgi:hypothetical protein
MSDNTPRLRIPELVSMQEANAVTWNETLVQLDAFVDLYLLGQFVNTPPGSPADGDAYLVGGSPTGAWSGYAYKIASCIDGAWRFYTPFNGLRAYVATTGAFIVYVGGVWTDWNSLISANEASIASAATCDLGAAGSLFVQITGNTTITSFGTGANKLRFVRFAQALTLTHNGTSLILLGGASRATAAGDVGIYASDASGNWRERSYFRAASNAGDYATKSGTETLTNKTLTSVIAPFTMAGSTASALQAEFTTNQGDFHLRVRNGSGTSVVQESARIGLEYQSAGYNCGISFIRGWGASDGFLSFATNGNRQIDLGPSGILQPYNDNTQNLGGASNRFATIYAGTGTINTSGAGTKTGSRVLSVAEIAIAKELAANVRVFQFCDAVAKKGEEAARLHVGMIYEDVVAAFTAQGLDPLRYGIVCRDPAMKTVVKTRAVQRVKTQTVTVEREQITVANGVATLATVSETREEQVTKCCPLIDVEGAPVVDPETGMHRIHFAPVMEEVEETYEIEEPDLDETGTQKWVLGLRYDELAQFVMAGLAARLAALEEQRENR